MDYPNKTFTNAGADLMAADDANSQATVVDKMIVSQSLPDESGEPLDEVTVDDFDNPMKFQIDNYKHQSHTFQVEAVLNNKGLQDDYPINMVGLLAHSQNANNDNETLLAVATADEPFILPKETNTPFNFRIGMALTYKNSNNITAVLSDAGTVDVQDLRQFKNDENKFVHSTVQVTLNQAANSFAVNSQKINKLSNNQKDFSSSASGTISSATSYMNSNVNAINYDNHKLSSSAYINSTEIAVTLNQLANNNELNNQRINNASASAKGYASSLSNNISANSIQVNSVNNLANINSNKIIITLNQLANDTAATNQNISSYNMSLSNVSSTATNATNTATNLANINSKNIVSKFKSLVVAFNQVAADNARLKDKIIG